MLFTLVILSLAVIIHQINNIMWYLTTWNGGRYSHISSERPARQDLANVINFLLEKGEKFYVSYYQYEYNGYSSRAILIDDETLEEIHISMEIAWGCHGVSHIVVYSFDNYYHRVIHYDSRIGIVGEWIAEEYRKIQNNTVLCLPHLTEEDFLYRELDRLTMTYFHQHAKDPRKEWPYSCKTLLEIGIIGIKNTFSKRYPAASRMLQYEKEEYGIIDYEDDDIIIL